VIVHGYRLAPYRAASKPGQVGHPLHIDPSWQGRGRADNPILYRALYYSESTSGAVAESFGDLRSWSEEMFEVPFLDGGRRALVRLDVDLPDETRQTLAYGLVGLAEGASRQLVDKGGEFDPDRTATEVSSLAWAGLRALQPRP